MYRKSALGAAVSSMLFARVLFAYAEPRPINLPLVFEANHGQSDPRVKYVRRLAGGTIFFTSDETVFRLGRSVLRTRLKGASGSGSIQGEGKLSSRINYYVDGNHFSTEAYSSILHRDVYPGIDLLYYGNQRHLEYDFHVKPGARPSAIHFDFEGARRLFVDSNGELVIDTADGQLRQHAPLVYQEVHGTRRPVEGSFVVSRSHDVTFRIGPYDHSKDLVIDPVLQYSTYLGGTGGTDTINNLAVDQSGAVYVVGTTGSPNFPQVNSGQGLVGSNDIFVAKLSPDGSSLIYSTLFGQGKSGGDSGNAITVDANGSAYFTGYRTDTNLLGDVHYAILGKLNPDGSLAFFNNSVTGSTGGADERPSGIRLDPQGNICVSGTSWWDTIPVVNGFATYSGSTSGFMIELDPTGQNIVYSSYIGTRETYANALAVDQNGAIYVTGNTYGVQVSGNAYQQNYNGVGIAANDAYVVKIDPRQSGAASFVYGTYLGGYEWDSGDAITVDAQGNAWVTGETKSTYSINPPGFPVTASAFQSDLTIKTYADTHCYATIEVIMCSDVFVTGLNGDGSQLLYSTYFGGSGNDTGRAIALDSNGLVYVGGQACGLNFPTTQNALQSNAGNCGTGMLAIFDPSKSGSASLLYSSFLGGSGNESVQGLGVDSQGNVYLAGWTKSTDFPTQHPLPGQSNGGGTLSSGFISKISFGNTTPNATVTLSTNIAGVTFNVSGNGCAPGSYPAPATLTWSSGASCSVTAIGPSGASFTNWADGPNANPRTFSTPATATTYTANFNASQTCTFMLSAMSAGFTSGANTGTVKVTTGAGCNWSATNNAPGWIHIDSGSTGRGAGSVAFEMDANSNPDLRVGTLTIAGQTFTVTQAGTATPAPEALRFVPITPCRVADTRDPDGPFGGPELADQTARDFVIPNSKCGIPASAQAYSLNVSVVPDGLLGYLTVYPSGQPQPFVATLTSIDGRVKGNAAIVPAGTNGAISVYAMNKTHVVLDINGYFVAATDSSALAFYPLPPCRVLDTRLADGPLGGPSLIGKQSRSFPILSSSCNVPANAQAYSLNFAAVPKGPLGYLTAWPTGQPQPFVAALNAPTGTVTANAVIVPAGANGDVSVFTTNDTDLVIDLNGYFAPAGSGGLSFYNLTPCRVLDTRQPAGSPAFTGARDVDVAGSSCGVPLSAEAYVINATAVPSGLLGYLTLWPTGQNQPFVSTVNALDGVVTSNLALVPAANGHISAFAPNPTHLVMDIFGYFAQ